MCTPPVHMDLTLSWCVRAINRRYCVYSCMYMYVTCSCGFEMRGTFALALVDSRYS